MAGNVDPQIYPARPKFFIEGTSKPELSDGLQSMSVEENAAATASFT